MRHLNSSVAALAVVAMVAISAAAPARAQQVHLGLGSLVGGIFGDSESKPTAQWQPADAQSGLQRLVQLGVDQFVANAAWQLIPKTIVSGGATSSETFGDFLIKTQVAQTQAPQFPDGAAYLVEQHIVGPNGAAVVVRGPVVWLRDRHGWGTVNVQFSVTPAPRQQPQQAQQSPAPATVAPAPRPQQVVQSAPSAPPPPPKAPHPPTGIQAMDEQMVAAKKAAVRPDCTGDFPPKATITAGDTVSVVGKGGNCFEVQIGNVTGWVLESSLKSPDSIPSQPPTAKPQQASTAAPSAPAVQPPKPVPASSPVPPPPPATTDPAPVTPPPSPSAPQAAPTSAPAQPAAPAEPPPPPAKPKVKVID